MQQRSWATRFALGVVLWLVPVAILWLLVTPVYNLFLTTATENLVRLSEDPTVTRLAPDGTHRFAISRTDWPPARGPIGSVRVTDTHFPLLMLGAFFLAVPGVSWRKRLESLGWAILISIFFHIVSLFLWVKFIYATQHGAWSAAQYDALWRNVWGLSKHLADLPFKFGLPVLLWAIFFLRDLLDARRDAA
ncbi:MAG: hypothetical protein AAGN46_12655 [Acidobacteriota bacterium]